MLPRSAKIAYGLSALGLLVGAIYYVVLAFIHQPTFVNDAILLVVFGAIFWLPLSIAVLCPAWVLIPRIVRAPSAEKRWFLTSIAVFMPTLAVIAGVVVQGTDWDELLLFVVPFLPTTVAVLGMTSALRAEATTESMRESR